MFLTYARKVTQKETSQWNSKFVFYCAPAMCQTQRKGNRTQSCYYYACALCVSAQRSGRSRFPGKISLHKMSPLINVDCVVICRGRKYRFFVCAERTKMDKAVISRELSAILKLKMLHVNTVAGNFYFWLGLWVLVNVHIHRHVGVSGRTQVQKTPSHAEKSRT